MQDDIMNPSSRNRKLDALCVASLFLISLIIMLKQITTPSYFSIMINDAFTYSSWAAQFSEALREGLIYPRWMPLDFGGYGSPTFIYYPPLSFYIVTFFHFFSNSITIAMNLTKFLSIFLSAVGIYFLVKELYSARTAVISAFFYLLLPYNVMHLYLLGSFASAISLMWFSPILLFSYKYFKMHQVKYLIYASACYAGLILTHVINAYMFTFVMLAFIIFLSFKQKTPKNLYTGTLILLIGSLLSSAYILPLIKERNLIDVSCFSPAGGFYFAEYFLQPDISSKALLNPFWPFTYKTFAMLALVIFYCCIAVLFTLFIHKTKRNKQPIHANSFHHFSLGIVLASIFLLFSPSRLFWEYIPFFKYIHFPFRWLNITTYGIALLFAAFIYPIKAVPAITRDVYFLVIVLFIMFVAQDYFYMSHAITFDEQELLPIRAESSSKDHLPVGVDVNKIGRNDPVTENVTVIKTDGNAKVAVWLSAERIIDLEANRPLTARIRAFNFPG